MTQTERIAYPRKRLVRRALQWLATATLHLLCDFRVNRVHLALADRVYRGYHHAECTATRELDSEAMGLHLD